MQGDGDKSMFEVVSTADWCQLVQRHAAGQQDTLRFYPHLPMLLIVHISRKSAEPEFTTDTILVHMQAGDPHCLLSLPVTACVLYAGK